MLAKKFSHIPKPIVILWGTFLIGLLAGFLFFFSISLGVWGGLPTFEELENPETFLATEIYSADNELLGKYYNQNRSVVEYRRLPQNLIDALVATEDRRFSEHSGIDLKALFRVLKGLVARDYSGGGSTITQQLAKNLFPRKRLNKFQLVIRKFKEWVIAVRLEKSYSKEEILGMYLNTVEFSDNAFGIKSAARTYFNIEVDSLSLEQSAVLVGMLKAPYKYNPRIHPENSYERRNVVLGQMLKYEFINQTSFDSLSNMPLIIDFRRASHDEGPAPYFRETLRSWLKQWVKDNPKPDGTYYDIYKDGLKVYTTIDSRMQKYAERAVGSHLSSLQSKFWKHWEKRDPWKDFPDEFEKAIVNSVRYNGLHKMGLEREEIDSVMELKRPMRIFSWRGEIDTLMSPLDSIRYYRMFLQCGFLAMEPSTGYIKSWVGGINYRHFKYDHACITTKRQIGSTFKPFVYTIAIRDKGYSPCTKIANELITFEKDDPRWPILKDWTPKNADSKYGGMMTIKDGLANSVNTITANLMHEMNPQAIIKLVRDMGIESEIEPYPSICLGTPDISLNEMIGAYSTYVNLGSYAKPQFLLKIEDKNGNTIEEFRPEKRQVLDEQTSYVMLQLLKNVVSQGTGVRLRYMYDLKNEIVGKTGTTQNHSDGWFIGLTPDLIAGTWVGCEDRFIRFRSLRLGQGASTALPVWAKYFQQIYQDSTINIDLLKRFEKPSRPLTIELDCSKYKVEEKSSIQNLNDIFEQE